MTADDQTTQSGEARLKANRRNFLRYGTMVMLATMVISGVAGYLTGMYDSGEVPIWLPIAAFVALLIGGTWFCFDYFRRVDELDLLDNLWSHLIGMYIGFAVFGGWYFAADLGLVSHPTVMPILGIMLVATFLVYGLRKLGLR